MKGNQIQHQHHVAHLCKDQHRLDDGTLSGAAFLFRAEDTDGLSCNWLEHAPGTRAEQLDTVRGLIRLKRRSNHRLAVINSGESRAAVLDGFGVNLSIIEDPLPADERYPIADPSHTLVEPPAADVRDAISAVLGGLAVVEPAI